MAGLMGAGGNFTLLWENNNQDESFSAQTIYLRGLTHYKYILIGFRGVYGIISSSIIPTKKKGNFYVVAAEHVCFVERNISIEDDKIAFKDAKAYNHYAQDEYSINNATLVPLIILGIV